MLLQPETGRCGGDLSAGMFLAAPLPREVTLVKWSILRDCSGFLGNSPHPSTPDEDDNQTELLIAEEKLSPEEEGQIMPR